MAVSPYFSNMHAYIFNMKSKETQPPLPGGAQAKPPLPPPCILLPMSMHALIAMLVDANLVWPQQSIMLIESEEDGLGP